MSEIRIRVEGAQSFFRRAREEARRIDAGQSAQSPNELSFESMETLAALLSTNRWKLLIKLREIGPASIRSLARALGRDYHGVHSDVAKLLDAGLVSRDAQQKIYVPWAKITAEVTLDAAA
ncbi:HVO_A0114 family putative DNA-binding protein [Mesorhizobium xinjiangense]|uniref:HVO_A0114 family putative DNA-binding protein n=1 Tax=Mesorhizobium xinjiangense TaxID=2678685 RepID=UPI0012ECC688|nr:hypothetical protein [Mesorhizobium xinjiangense]